MHPYKLWAFYVICFLYSHLNNSLPQNQTSLQGLLRWVCLCPDRVCQELPGSLECRGAEIFIRKITFIRCDPSKFA